MLSAKPWQFESVMILVLGVLLGMVLGGLLGLLLQPVLLPRLPMDKGFFQFLLNLICFHGAALFLLTGFLRQHGVGWGRFLGPFRPGWFRGIALALLVAGLLVPITLALNRLCVEIIQAIQWTPEQQMTVRILRQSEGWGHRLAFAFSAIVSAPLVEETLFRGVLYPMIKQRGHPRAALWVTALLFALIHTNLMTFLPLTLVALAFTWLYERTDMLWAPVLAHALFNSFNFLLLVYDDQISAWLHQIQQHVKP